MTTPHWHLHATVKPHWSWTLRDVTEALRRDIERHDIKPVVITNHFRDPGKQPYRELIPTRIFAGTESAATRELFTMGLMLNNAGWRVKRLKIEGDPRCVTPGRAIYYECHLRDLPGDIPLPRSTTPRSTFHTCRERHGGALQATLARHFPEQVYKSAHIEACVLDTAPERDDEWIGEYR